MHLRELHSAIGADSSKRNGRKIKPTSALLSRVAVGLFRSGGPAIGRCENGGMWKPVPSRTLQPNYWNLRRDLCAEIELYRLIKVRRRIGYYSIGTLLGCDKRFKKVGRGIWALKKKRA